MTSEGEGQETVAVWRSEHGAFWHSAEHRGALRDLTLTVDDDTPVVLTRFRLVHLVRARAGRCGGPVSASSGLLTDPVGDTGLDTPRGVLPPT